MSLYIPLTSYCEWSNSLNNKDLVTEEDGQEAFSNLKDNNKHQEGLYNLGQNFFTSCSLLSLQLLLLVVVNDEEDDVVVVV